MATVSSLITKITGGTSPDDMPPTFTFTDFKKISLSDFVNWRQNFGGNRIQGIGVFKLSDAEQAIYDTYTDAQKRKSSFIAYDSIEEVPVSLFFIIDDKRHPAIYPYLPALEAGSFYGNIDRVDVTVPEKKNKGKKS